MQTAYPELNDSADRIAAVVDAEENQFDRVLKIGLAAWEERVQLLMYETMGGAEGSVSFTSTGENHVTDVKRNGAPIVFPGKDAFRFYETFGMPLDFMVDAAVMPSSTLIKNVLMGQGRGAGAGAGIWKGGSQKSAAPVYRELAKTEFEGYSTFVWMGLGCWRW